MKYKVILLDMDDTLFDFEQAERFALESTYHALGLKYSEEDLLFYKEINNKLWDELENGKLSIEKLKLERFTQLTQKRQLGITDLAMNELYITYLGEAIFEVEGAFEVCTQLSKNYQLAVLTNGITCVQRSRLKQSRMGQYITEVIISEEVGYSKPEKQIFEVALSRLGATKEQVLMVGDSLSSDIKGGIAAGIDTCWYNPTRKQTAVKPNYEIHTMTDLINLLT